MEWIDVSERLPVDAGKYLVISANTKDYDVGVTTSYFMYREWGLTNISHWMPLPGPPKE